MLAPLASLAVIFGLIVLPNSGTAEEVSKSKTLVITADQALTQLEQGNRRCVEGKSSHGHEVAGAVSRQAETVRDGARMQ
jgi:hypothetical protein